MTRFVVDARYHSLFTQLRWDSYAAILEAFIPADASPSRKVFVVSRTIASSGREPLVVFCKRYSFASPSWKFWLRASKARREYDNYGVFERLGIPCAQRIAWGEQRDRLGRLRQAFILTRAIPAAVTLIEFVLKHSPTRKHPASRTARRRLCDELAMMVRTMHAGQFFHNDLYWRNVMVASPPARDPTLWWLDCPRGRLDSWSPLRARRRLKDLAALDIEAAKLCSNSERLRFIKTYLQVDKLNAPAKELIREVLAYRARRWPESNAT